MALTSQKTKLSVHIMYETLKRPSTLWTTPQDILSNSDALLLFTKTPIKEVLASIKHPNKGKITLMLNINFFPVMFQLPILRTNQSERP
jgi:hypothetical protein